MSCGSSWFPMTIIAHTIACTVCLFQPPPLSLWLSSPLVKRSLLLRRVHILDEGGWRLLGPEHSSIWTEQGWSLLVYVRKWQIGSNMKLRLAFQDHPRACFTCIWQLLQPYCSSIAPCGEGGVAARQRCTYLNEAETAYTWPCIWVGQGQLLAVSMWIRNCFRLWLDGIIPVHIPYSNCPFCSSADVIRVEVPFKRGKCTLRGNGTTSDLKFRTSALATWALILLSKGWWWQSSIGKDLFHT